MQRGEPIIFPVNAKSLDRRLRNVEKKRVKAERRQEKFDAQVNVMKSRPPERLDCVLITLTLCQGDRQGAMISPGESEEVMGPQGLAFADNIIVTITPSPMTDGGLTLQQSTAKENGDNMSHIGNEQTAQRNPVSARAPTESVTLDEALVEPHSESNAKQEHFDAPSNHSFSSDSARFKRVFEAATAQAKRATIGPDWTFERTSPNDPCLISDSEIWRQQREREIAEGRYNPITSESATSYEALHELVPAEDAPIITEGTIGPDWISKPTSPNDPCLISHSEVGRRQKAREIAESRFNPILSESATSSEASEEPAPAEYSPSGRRIWTLRDFQASVLPTLVRSYPVSSKVYLLFFAVAAYLSLSPKTQVTLAKSTGRFRCSGGLKQLRVRRWRSLRAASNCQVNFTMSGCRVNYKTNRVARDALITPTFDFKYPLTSVRHSAHN